MELSYCGVFVFVMMMMGSSASLLPASTVVFLSAVFLLLVTATFADNLGRLVTGVPENFVRCLSVKKVNKCLFYECEFV